MASVAGNAHIRLQQHRLNLDDSIFIERSLPDDRAQLIIRLRRVLSKPLPQPLEPGDFFE
jgi:hypothetical protein